MSPELQWSAKSRDGTFGGGRIVVGATTPEAAQAEAIERLRVQGFERGSLSYLVTIEWSTGPRFSTVRELFAHLLAHELSPGDAAELAGRGLDWCTLCADQDEEVVTDAAT